MGKPDEVIDEENLLQIYGIDVKIFRGSDGRGQEKIKFCTPSLKEITTI